MYHVLTPAYGRDYRSKAAILADLVANKDFILNAPSGTAVLNLGDLQGDMSSSWSSLQIRYGKLRKVCVLTRAEIEKAQKQVAA